MFLFKILIDFLLEISFFSRSDVIFTENLLKFADLQKHGPFLVSAIIGIVKIGISP